MEFYLAVVVCVGVSVVFLVLSIVGQSCMVRGVVYKTNMNLYTCTCMHMCIRIYAYVYNYVFTMFAFL